MLMMIELFLNGQNRILFVQSAGNGYKDSGHAIDASRNGSYAAVTEENYNSLNKNGVLSDAGYSYESFKSHIIIVGAAENNNGDYQLTFFSNYGLTDDGGVVDIVAPGKDIFSAVTTKDDYLNHNLAEDGVEYRALDGTSMSAPMVAASAALIWSIDPSLDADEVKTLLIETSKTAKKYWEEDYSEQYPMLNVGAAVSKTVDSMAKGKVWIACDDECRWSYLLRLRRDGTCEYSIVDGVITDGYMPATDSGFFLRGTYVIEEMTENSCDVIVKMADLNSEAYSLNEDWTIKFEGENRLSMTKEDGNYIYGVDHPLIFRKAIEDSTGIRDKEVSGNSGT
jgi:hypothetical protein